MTFCQRLLVVCQLFTLMTQNTPLHLAWAKHGNFCLSSDGNRIANGVKVPCVFLVEVKMKNEKQRYVEWSTFFWADFFFWRVLLFFFVVAGFFRHFGSREQTFGMRS